ncbi:TonB-dependent receptor [Leptolyngbya sp. 7M]|uniref:TonB-dependent receptor n=1 Tax=Leptolyngbya sp. 7M TaxID=2812896 RepID=UPI001B8CCCB2|nr:TonB-dependent receptor [Leptolyngbya sp. 7M]QYO66341.1 TonB-dependent receptor [Leptolyngbya sp. 7M]
MRSVLNVISDTAKQSVLFVVSIFILASLVQGQAQSAAADLAGTVVDPNGAVVQGATVTARNIATNISRTTTSGSDGTYRFIALPPGEYEINAEAASFKKVSISPVRLTVGQSAELRISLEIGTPDAVVTVTGDDVDLIETTRTTVAATIDQRRIENLPINERSATGFALTLSTVGRDNGRPIGPAPTSGLNIGGQRGRSTLVQVDGADFTDNSVNAARTTVSMEAVQEYQVATNSYAPEFGRATGGIVNVVTKRGTNDWSGNVFGFLRDKNIQARNAFAPVAKPDFRRTQWGGTLGGPIVKDRTFFFASYERRQRDESGFFTSNPSAGLGSTITVGQPILPFTQVFSGLTSAQAAWANQLLGSGNPAFIQAAVGYLYLASSGSQTALTGTNQLISPGAPSSPIPAGQPVGARFFLSSAPVPSGTIGSNGLPIAFRPLNDLQRIFPVTERTNFFSIRGDHSINANNQLSLRFGYNPGTVTGIQVESQNQSLGQNDFSRTGIQELTDTSFSATLNTSIGASKANEFKFSFGHRDTSFRSQNGEAVAFNISGTAFIGRELFSPVDRTERRIQFADNFTWVWRNHTFKFGGDVNFVDIPRAVFELNFAGLFNFGPFAAGNLNAAFGQLGAPDLTPVQAYGLGLPSTYIQGFGDPVSKIKNRPLAFFAQDSWKVHPRLTLNYGIRYDVELTETIQPVAFSDPLSGINLTSQDLLAAQDAVGVQQGIPRDTNNWAPRFGFAWDTRGDGKTVIRGAAGLFYDHPLLAVAFNSDIADAAQQQQAVLTAGSPVPVGSSGPTLLNAALVFHGTVCGNQGSNAALCAAFGNPVTPGVATSAQYQFGRQRFNDQTFSGFGAVLPFILPVAKDFQYAYATQANLTIEQQLTRDMSLSVGYIFVGARHLPHPTDLNTPDTAKQIQNFVRCFGTLPTSTQAVATVNPAACTAPGTWVNVIPGMISINTTTGQGVIAPAVANFFRPNAPNYFLARALSGGAVTKAVLDNALANANTLRTPGVISPFGAVNAQISDGNSSYNAMNVELNRRFARNFAFRASYTWSHSIDDSSDLQTLLIAQDVKRFNLEKADSLFDQRHRFVFSGLLSSPDGWRNSDSGWRRVFADFTIAPIIEISSGRPFNIITNTDTNNDQSSQTDRPSVAADGSLCVPGRPGCTPLITDGRFSIGNLGRNRGITHSFASFDLRLSRAFRWSERYRIDVIAEGFNLFNRFNEASASPFVEDVNAFGQSPGGGKYYSRPTAAFDSRQFQLGVRFSF